MFNYTVYHERDYGTPIKIKADSFIDMVSKLWREHRVLEGEVYKVLITKSKK